MHRTSMYVYPWDLRDEGAGPVADRLRAAGIKGVTLSTTYHTGRFLRPHGPKGKMAFSISGQAYFTPNPSLYRTLVPERAAMVEDYDALAALAKEAPDLPVTAWTIGLHNSRLGRLHPELATHTLYGDVLANSLCPSQPEVRHYMVALALDTAAQPGVREIAIEAPGWQAFRHGDHHEFELIELPENVQVMLGTCFCDACRSSATAAGVDFDGIARRSRAELDTFFETGAVPATDPRHDPDWAAFQSWRGETVSSLMAEVRAALPADVSLAVIPTVLSPNDLCWIEGSDLAGLAKAADRLEIPAYQVSPTKIASDAARVRLAAGDEAEIGYILRPTWPHLLNGPEVTEAVRLLRALRPASISFYNYGHMRLSSLDWVKTALARD